MTGGDFWAAVARRRRDPRWQWLQPALEEIFDSLGHEDRVLALSVTFEDSGFEVLMYAKGWGNEEVRRFLCANPDASSAAFDAAYIDVTPDSSSDLTEGDRQ